MNYWHIGTTTITIAFLAGSAALTRASSPAQSTTAPVNDRALASQIKAKLKTDLTLAGYKIDVDLNDGVVTVGGTVKTEAQRRHAQRLATVMGVKYVRNEIIVDPTTVAKPVKAAERTSESTPDRVAGKTKAGVGKALDATKKGVETAADKTKEGTDKAIDATKTAGDTATAGAAAGKDAGQNVGQKIGEAFSDGSITGKVKAKVEADALLKNSDLKVETADHVVTLKGTVRSPEGKARAEDIARATDGVQQVINLLTVQK